MGAARPQCLLQSFQLHSIPSPYPKPPMEPLPQKQPFIKLALPQNKGGWLERERGAQHGSSSAIRHMTCGKAVVSEAPIFQARAPLLHFMNLRRDSTYSTLQFRLSRASHGQAVPQNNLEKYHVRFFLKKGQNYERQEKSPNSLIVEECPSIRIISPQIKSEDAF